MSTAAPLRARSTELGRGVHIVLPGQTPAGEHVLSVLLKRSYDISPERRCQRAPEDRPLVPGDVFWDSPMNSSVRYESDFVPFKLGTDVVLNGQVHAPGGEATYSCSAFLQVADRAKEIVVIGNRTARYAGGATPVFSDPEPFQTMEMRYERAYGGTDVFSDPSSIYPYPNNPLGCGFALSNTKTAVENLPLPNIEDPNDLLTPERLCIGAYANWKNQPLPAGFGWYPKTWMARAKYAGIMPADRAFEQEMRQEYAKLLSADQRATYLKHGIRDMDFSFFQGASRGLAMPYLAGNEEIWTENLSPDGRVHFALPAEAPQIGLDIGNGVQTPPTQLQTVMIHMEERQLDLVWRCAVPYPGRDWLPEMQKMEVHVQ